MEPDGSFVSWLNQYFATIVLALYQFYLLCTCCFLLCSSNAMCLFTHLFFFILQGMRGIEWGATSLSTNDRRETLIKEYESTFYQMADSPDIVLMQFTGMLRPACTTVSERDTWFVGLYRYWAGIFCQQVWARYKVCKIWQNWSSLFGVCKF